MSRYETAPHLTGDILLERWQRSGEGQRAFHRKHYADELTFDAFHGRIWRALHGIDPQPELFTLDLGKPLELTGDWMIVGDVQLPSTAYEFAILPAIIAERHLKRPRQLLIVGDLVNMDCFSDYAKIIGLPSFRQEMMAARQLIEEWYTVFDRIVYLAGNHERRLSKHNDGELLMQDLAGMISQRIETSNYDRAIIHSPTGDWLALHGTEYSVNQLVVGDQHASKYRMHIIGHHQHHLAVGWNRYKQNVVIDNGGLFNEWFMAYVQLDSSKKARMMQGFTMLRGGYPYVFSQEPFTNWADWLPDYPRRVKRKQWKKAG